MAKRNPLYTTRAWRQLRVWVLARDGGQCQVQLPGVCIGAPATHVDHIVPLSVDPDRAMDPTNLRAACSPCNLHLGGKLGAARARATRRRPGRRPPRVRTNGYGRW